ncbi:YcaO-like family protein [Legionella sp. W05-934-2]|uniref:YcaO-like family protein n=1 Tax=Legionella sp. W05-934-2 TaxID=1198649 RepID=UPI00346210AF
MFDLIGTYRSAKPLQTLAIIEPLASHYDITRIAHITGLDTLGIPTYVAYRPNSRSLSCSQGKGVSHALAKVSAIMEAIEFHCIEHLPPADLHGSFQVLSKTYPLYPLDTISKTLIKVDLLETSIDWLKGYDLINQQPIYFPRDMIGLDKSQNNLTSLALWPSSNGLASGNTYEEALCHALFELIERDMFETTSDRIVDLEKLTDPTCQQMVNTIQEQAKLVVTDVTNQRLSMPIYKAVITDKANANRLSLGIVGHGCHLSAQVAFLRAITEAAQARLTYISGARDDIPIHLFSPQLLYRMTPKVAPNCLLQEINTMPNTMTEMLNLILDRLVTNGHGQVIVYRLTPDDCPFAVVRALIPTLSLDEASHFIHTSEVV